MQQRRLQFAEQHYKIATDCHNYGVLLCIQVSMLVQTDEHDDDEHDADACSSVCTNMFNAI